MASVLKTARLASGAGQAVAMGGILSLRGTGACLWPRAAASAVAQLRGQYRLKLPDAVQLASALDIGAAALVTHDRNFSSVQGLPVLTGEPL